MSIHVTPIPRLTQLTTPAFTLGTANAAGSAITSIASDSTLLAFDTTVPDAITFGQSGAAGSATVTARRDHAHAMAADPTTAVAGSSMVLVGTATASSSASLTIEGLSSTYDLYMISWQDIVPASDGASLRMRVGDSSGIDSGASDYAYMTHRTKPNALHAVGTNSTGDSYMAVTGGVGSAAGEGCGGVVWLTRPGDGTQRPAISGITNGLQGDTSLNAYLIGGQRTSVITLDRVQILFSTGNIASGRFSVYGIKYEN